MHLGAGPRPTRPAHLLKCGPEVDRRCTSRSAGVRRRTRRCTGPVGGGPAWPQMHFNGGVYSVATANLSVCLCVVTAIHCWGCRCLLQCAEIIQKFPTSHYLRHFTQCASGPPSRSQCKLSFRWRNVCSRQENNYRGDTGSQSQQQARELWSSQGKTGGDFTSFAGNVDLKKKKNLTVMNLY